MLGILFEAKDLKRQMKNMVLLLYKAVQMSVTYLQNME